MKNTSGLRISRTATRLTRLGKTMSKTLADMTAEERQECVGMWCSIAGAGRLCVLLSTENDVANLGFSCDNEFTILSLRYKNVTPRFDLPRAWTPDGQPVDMNKEYGQCEMGGTPDGAPAIIVHVDDGRTEYASEDAPDGEVYRWVGEWEQDNEH